MAAKIKKGDKVIVLTGRDKGRTGEVISVMPKESRVLVRGVNMVKRHTRPTQVNPGGIVDKEGPIHVSNVAVVDTKTDKPARVGFRVLDNGTKVRFSRASGEVLDR